MGIIGRLISMSGVRASKPIEKARAPRYDPDPDRNPNRCMECLLKQGGTKGRYTPSSDSMLFDTEICGGCGQLDEVCDPDVVDAYRGMGIDVSSKHLFQEFVQQKGWVVRLRYRRDYDQISTSRQANMIQVETMDDAIACARSFTGSLDALRKCFEMMGLDPAKMTDLATDPGDADRKHILLGHVGLDTEKLAKQVGEDSDLLSWVKMYEGLKLFPAKDVPAIEKGKAVDV